MATKNYHLSEEEIKKILTTSFHPAFVNNWVVVNGCWLTETYKPFADDIINFEVRDDDVWICTFPKCGTTWAQEMIWCIGNDLDFVKAKAISQQERFPFLEFGAIADHAKREEAMPEGAPKIPAYIKNSIEFIKNIEGRRYIKTHLPLQLLPKQLISSESRAKIVYVARNPRDVCVSYFHHCRLLQGYNGDLDTFLKLFLNDKVRWSPFWKHILDFWKQRHEPNLLFLTYEEMKSDLTSVIGRVAEFLDKQLTPAQVLTLQQHLSFDSMKNNPSVNMENLVSSLKSITGNDGNFIRSGESGAFNKSLTEEQIGQINEWSKIHLEGTDYIQQK